MAKNTCDGEVYIRNLSSFIKSHERQLANALVAYKKLSSKDQMKPNSVHDDSQGKKNNNNNLTESRGINAKLSEKNANNTDNLNTADIDTNSNDKSSTKGKIHGDTDNISESKPDEEDSLTKEISKPVRLSLSLHHLYFILGKFQELGISVGPMNLRLDNIDSENNTNYVSFLSEFQRNKKIDSDSQSIHSISSVKSVMSSVSALWNTFSSSSKIDNTISDLKYLYSAFSKLPCLRLANEPNAKLIEGHEEYPFETATPIVIFKNLLVLEISDLDPKEIYGWNILANKLRYLVVKQANLTDPAEILINLVEADLNVRGEDDDYTENDDTFTFKIDGNQLTMKNDNEHYEDCFADDNKLAKTTSNGSDVNEFSEKTSHRNSAAISSIPLSHSSLSLASSLSTSKNHTSPTLHQAQSFSASQHALSSHHLPSHGTVSSHSNPYSHSHNYNHAHYHYYHHNPLSSESLASFSTSPTATSYSSNYHPNRLYAEDILSAGSPQSALSSSVHSTRRSYYYKPQKKSRRSRGSSSMIVSPNTGMTPISNPISQSLTNASLKSVGDSSGFAEPPTKLEVPRKVDEANPLSKKLNIRGGTDDVKTSSESQSSDSSSKSWRLLKHLSLTDNKIEKISLKSFDHLTNLTLLDLSYNNLTSIPSEPFSKLVNLKTLNLSFNKLLTLEKFPKSLTKLTVLNLRGNKISDLDSLENLSLLQKIDLRQNKLHKVSNLKPLLLLNKDKVLLVSVQLLGNPIAKSRGYRVELFNLFNGVDYSNNVRIDGSRPGIFESRMLLDEKTSKMRFKNYMDESIISKMTASVSNMNLSNIISHTTKNPNSFTVSKGITSNSPHSVNLRQNSFSSNSDHKNNDYEINTPVLDQMTTSITVQSEGNNRTFNKTSMPALNNSSSILKNHEKDNVVSHLRSNMTIDQDDAANYPVPDNATTTSAGSFAPPTIAPGDNPQISPSPSLLSIRNPVTLSFLNSNTNPNSNPSDLAKMTVSSSNGISDFNAPINRSASHSQRASNDFSSTSSIITSSTTTANVDSNPIARLSLASPALPVITQATTTTMTITSVSNPMDARNPNNDSSRTDYIGNDKPKANDENKENESAHAVSDDPKISNDDFSSGLKISVI